MKLELDPNDVKALRQEDGEATTFAISQDDGELLVRVGGITLGQPAEVNGKLVFDHDFPADAIAVLTSRSATRKAVVGATPITELDDSAFATWRSGMQVAVGDVLRFEETTYEVIQAHTTQADWTPPVVPALFKLFREPVEPGGGTPLWEAGISVLVGEQYLHNGITYQVLQAHTTQVGWEPPNVPALWSAI